MPHARAHDYTIQPLVGDATLATSLAQLQLEQRRQPIGTATVTITNDGSSRYAILKHGCVVPTLATARPGSLRGHDIRANAALTAGCATHVEWWASQTQAPSTSNSPSRSPAPGAGKQHTAISLTAPCVQGIAS